MIGADPVAVLTPTFAVGLAVVHLFGARLLSLDVIPRSPWLSLAGGVSVAYVFVHVLPELAAAAETIERSESALAAIEYHVYLVVLTGFVAFFGLERYVREASGEGDGEREPDGVFWLHTASFGAYNALVGYLLVHRDERGVTALALFFVAMALHFVVNDYGLRSHHGRTYHRYGRWVLAGAVLVGFAVGYTGPVSEVLVAVLFAFLAGGVILNVMKEELPSERRSRFWAFAGGVAGYALVLLAI
ncbi:hypothetical protein [Salinilacihabitans rarus]|uniref:hypothetical protein n=1 Tax=Salinilacihabitans rarus TaxID=2961596 RepID=UPI0020C85E5D|nr:hypothetical protein [Salinilacihabitans rarus]